jgi:CheY-like chemotaxis protein
MKKNTILWADDDADDLQMMREILLKNGKSYSIREVQNGRQALDYLDQARREQALPCLIILDINMPVMDGKQTLSAIKSIEAYRSIPVVVFTTSASELDQVFCERMGTPMITKPPSYARLETTVVQLLEYCH